MKFFRKAAPVVMLTALSVALAGCAQSDRPATTPGSSGSAASGGTLTFGAAGAPKLFDPFFSTKEGGNGLGLALTQQIIRDHGGDLRVDSTSGRGTTFTVSVPAGG